MTGKSKDGVAKAYQAAAYLERGESIRKPEDDLNLDGWEGGQPNPTGGVIAEAPEEDTIWLYMEAEEALLAEAFVAQPKCPRCGIAMLDRDLAAGHCTGPVPGGPREGEEIDRYNNMAQLPGACRRPQLEPRAGEGHHQEEARGHRDPYEQQRRERIARLAQS